MGASQPLSLGPLCTGLPLDEMSGPLRRVGDANRATLLMTCCGLADMPAQPIAAVCPSRPEPVQAMIARNLSPVPPALDGKAPPR